MKKTIREIKKGIPEIESQKVEDIAETLDSILATKRIFTSEDGKVLLKVLRNNCASYLTQLIMKSKDNPDLSSLLGLIAAYSANLDLLAQMQDIKMEEELRNQLDEAVREAME